MIKLKNKTSGFTLIEMMVVIAVIGILSTAVLAGLAPGRKKARDARVISGVNQARTIVEANADVAGYPGDGALLADTQFKIANADVNTVNQQGIKYKSGVNEYVLWARLASDFSKYYCVDFQGAAKTVGVEPNANTCP